LVDAGTTMLVSTHLMDEAERCHRLAILDHGVLVADGTPRELTGQLDGRTFTVTADDPRRAQRALVDVPGVLGVAQVGNTLRVLTSETGRSKDGGTTDTAGRLREALRDAGQHADVAPAAANLEDVFVAVTRNGSDREESAA
ncbi:MAG TPA: ABC transporter ATP-binding protein, partial [Rhodanobacteraceae bacterium]|nr:ABC transporter ATP-binding protein [Rhodanobacteraceae bacterium]